MNASRSTYTTQLQAGLGLVNETKLLLSLYEKDLTANFLYEKSLQSGLFPLVSARRLRNIVIECFAPRYIKTKAANYLKPLATCLPSSTMNQLFLIYTAGANEILQDFIQEIYWDRYTGGRDSIQTDDAKEFVVHAVREGKTQKPWSDSTIKRMASYLMSCCADYGLLSSRRGAKRAIQPVRIQEFTVLYLAYKLHFEGLGDSAMINHKTWALFGLDASDVREELKGLAKNGWIIVQSAGEVTRIGWQLKTMEDVIDVITQS
ncbi:BrxA family protein [Granulosicoccus sp. 3-233]|uniref:BrxA family protein n=1 Tax=Granulosicoccus sp. 3-233 TaxID=3417969 RepID=UPI003D3541A0